jgi:hypothetical protein
MEKGTSRMRASVWASTVLPDPVGPIEIGEHRHLHRPRLGADGDYGRVDRPASPEELDKMRKLVDRDARRRRSSGLVYVPGTFTPFTEFVELAKVAGRFGGHYQSHIRDEGQRRGSGRAGSHRGRRAGRTADTGDAPQDGRTGKLGTERRDAAPD